MSKILFILSVLKKFPLDLIIEAFEALNSLFDEANNAEDSSNED